MSCLMERLGTEMMSEECETALLQMQYFVARDYKLDSKLYRGCREDAARLCHAKRAWADSPASTDPERGVLVLPCLYRYTLPLNNSKFKVCHFTSFMGKKIMQDVERFFFFFFNRIPLEM